MAHGRIAMEVKAAGIFKQAVHVANPYCHSRQVGNGAFAYADAVEGFDELCRSGLRVRSSFRVSMYERCSRCRQRLPSGLWYRPCRGFRTAHCSCACC